MTSFSSATTTWTFRLGWLRSTTAGGCRGRGCQARGTARSTPTRRRGGGRRGTSTWGTLCRSVSVSSALRRLSTTWYFFLIVFTSYFQGNIKVQLSCSFSLSSFKIYSKFSSFISPEIYTSITDGAPFSPRTWGSSRTPRCTPSPRWRTGPSSTRTATATAPSLASRLTRSRLFMRPTEPSRCRLCSAIMRLLCSVNSLKIMQRMSCVKVDSSKFYWAYQFLLRIVWVLTACISLPLSWDTPTALHCALCTVQWAGHLGVCGSSARVKRLLAGQNDYKDKLLLGQSIKIPPVKITL